MERRHVSGPAFSVVTPARNALPQLRRCIGSVRGQQGVDFEHLVHDAQSGDGSAAWLVAQAAADPRLRPLSERDDGMYDAINRGWARAGGRFLSWLNADEQYLPGTLQRVQQLFDERPQAEVLFADYLVADDSGRAVALRREIPLRRFNVVNSFLNLQSCTMFFRRTLWDRGLLRLDSRYRYAADKDLVLRLHDAGVRFEHVPEVWSVFGVDGHNLSTHAAMAQEAEAIRRAHGALRFKPLRALALGARRIERAWRGAYRRDDLQYRWAIDEVPHYAEFRARGLGGRYSLADVQGRAERLDAPLPAERTPT
jgi:glycosyltransferase involved in cell wall biosynthesis